MIARRFMLLAPLLLAACAGGSDGGIDAGIDTDDARPLPRVVHHPPPPPPAVAQPYGAAGEEGIIGASADALIRSFGPPRLDEAEGEARKLQFAGACVLDIYLYPSSRGSRPRATYLEARLADGRAANRAACISALRRR